MKELNTDTWISVKEAEDILSLRKRQIKYNCKKRKYITKLINGNGGKQYRILLTSLPVRAQLNYCKGLGNEADIVHREDLADDDEANLDELTEKQLQTALARANLVSIYIDTCEQKAGTGEKLTKKETFIRVYNNQTMEEIYKAVGEVKFKTLERWKRAYVENNRDFRVLAPRYKHKAASVSNEEAEILVKKYLHPNQPLIAEVVSQSIEIFQIRNFNHIKSPITYRRFLDNFCRENAAMAAFFRKGEHALEYYLPNLERDYDKIEVGDIIVADGHVLNFEIINPFTGKPKRMTLILFYDMKSSMPLGWEIMPTENVAAIAVALRRAVLMLGKSPRVIYIDNGRAFGAKYFKGVDLNTCGITGLFERIQSKVITAWPYHAQSKTIERFFRTFAELERMMPTYSGTSIELKPARMNRGEKLHVKAYEKMVDIASWDLMAAHRAIAWWFDRYSQRPQQSGHLKGKKPIDIFNNGKGAGVDKTELMFLMMKQEIKTIYSNGIRFLNGYYYNEALFGLRKEVYIRYDLYDMSSVFVFDVKTGEYICEAFNTANDKVHPAAELLGTDADKDKLRTLLERKASLKKLVVGEFRQFAKEQIIPETMKLLQDNNIINGFSGEGEDIKYLVPDTKKKRNKKIDILEQLEGYSPDIEDDEIATFDFEKKAAG